MTRKIFHQNRPGILLFFLCSSLLAFTAFFYVRDSNSSHSAYPNGDEPHYLIISQTLLKYHSLDVMLDYTNHDYRSFYPTTLDAHVTPNQKGQLRSVHSIGGPVLWLVPFALFGRIGAVLFVAFLTTLVILNMYLLLCALGINERYALIVCFIYTIASPIYIYAHLTFIEPIGAFICVFVLRKVCEPRLRKWDILVCSLLLGLLPWIHIRFTLLTGILFLSLLYRMSTLPQLKEKGPYLSAFLPLLFCFLCFECYNYSVWGTLNPAANQANLDTHPFSKGPFLGLLGLGFDQEHGLFLTYPIFFLLLAGCALQKRFSLYNILSLFLVVSYLPIISTLNDWSGGTTPPARYLVVLLPVFSYYVAYALEQLPQLIATLVLGTATLFGFCQNLLDTNYGFNRGSGQNQGLEHIIIPLLNRPLTEYLPSIHDIEIHHRNIPYQIQLVTIWCVVYFGFSCFLIVAAKLKAKGDMSREDTQS